MCRFLTSFVIFVIFATAYGQEVVQDARCQGPDLQFLPDLRDCSFYVTCYNGMAFRQQCPSGLLFDPVEVMCNFADRVECAECPAVGIVAIKLTCETYRLCINGEGIVKTCQAGTIFNEEEEECYPGNDCPFLPCVGFGNRSEIGFQRNPDCRTYHICLDGAVLANRTCPDGTYFDHEVTRTCVAGALPAGCDTDTQQPANPDDPETPVFQPIRPRSALAFKKAQVTMSNECPEIGVEMIPMPNDCTKYAICVNRQEFIFDCPMGTLYSPEHKLCTLPQFSSCQ